MSKDKPPIGVKPTWLVALQRIRELIDAIERQHEIHNGDENLVKLWAEEITWQCTKIIEAFREKT